MLSGKKSDDSTATLFAVCMVAQVKLKDELKGWVKHNQTKKKKKKPDLLTSGGGVS